MPPLLAVALIVFLQIVALGAIFPTLTAYTESFGGTVFWGGVLFALVTAPKILLNPFWGRFSDRIGRKPVLSIMFGGTIAGSVLWALSPVIGGTGASGLLVLALSRLIVGVFTAQAGVALSIASDTTTSDKRAGAMGLLGAAFGMGMLTGIGASIAMLAMGASLASIGWLCAGFEIAALLCVWLLLKETHHPGDAPTTPRIYELLEMIGRTGIRSILTITMLTWMGASVLIPTLTNLAVDRFGFDEKRAPTVFLAWGLAGVVAQGGLIRPMVKRLGERKTAIVGFALAIFAFMWVAGGSYTLALWGGMVLVGIGGGLVGPSITAMLTHTVGADQQGRVHGLSQSATSLGRAAGMLGGGALYEIAPQAPYWCAAIILALAVVMMIAMRPGQSSDTDAAPASP